MKLFITSNKEVELKYQLATIVTENEFQDTIIKLNQNNKQFKTYTLSAPLPERMTVNEIIKFWCKWYETDITKETVLHKASLTPFSHKRIKKLTYSELKLLHIARLIIVPETQFIIKEPLQNISIETKHIIINLLNDLSKHNSIITLTNHTEEALLISENC
ncbi:MAG TPA: ABC transporter ATP-binding protein, partial [Staphylococcus sp.]|nr:ABC transporter ATP-binding protein [Staphylococcus sp.]